MSGTLKTSRRRFRGCLRISRRWRRFQRSTRASRCGRIGSVRIIDFLHLRGRGSASSSQPAGLPGYQVALAPTDSSRRQHDRCWKIARLLQAPRRCPTDAGNLANGFPGQEPFVTLTKFKGAKVLSSHTAHSGFGAPQTASAFTRKLSFSTRLAIPR